MFDASGQSDAGGLTPGEFNLLTDALRAGPGTQEWIRAVQQFKNGQGTNELRALLKARQHLEAGKSFRSLETSPRLTQTVLASIAAEGAPRFLQPRHAPFSLSSKPIVALMSVAATLLVVVGGLVFESLYLENGNEVRSSVTLPSQRYANYLPNSTAFSAFDSVIPATWKPIGSLRVEAKRGLHLAGGMKHIDQSGGIVWQDKLPRNKSFKVLTRLKCSVDSMISPEIFLTDDGTFDDNVPTDPSHEFVWSLSNNRPLVRAGNQSIAVAGDAIVTNGPTQTMAVDIKFEGANATVETSIAGHCTHWTGPHQLAAGKPLWMGVRFVVRGSHKDDCTTFESVRVAIAR
jgi:hypothetical protein